MKYHILYSDDRYINEAITSIPSYSPITSIPAGWITPIYIKLKFDLSSARAYIKIHGYFIKKTYKNNAHFTNNVKFQIKHI